jgi:hypothetical protein
MPETLDIVSKEVAIDAKDLGENALNMIPSQSARLLPLLYMGSSWRKPSKLS